MGQGTQICQTKANTSQQYDAVRPGANFTATGTRFHFIGAGGVGMSGLAQLMIKNKAIVTGSDQTESMVLDELRRAGAKIQIGHKPQNLDSQTDAVVISAAIKDDNPELMLARKNGLKVFKYAEMLGVLMNRYRAIAIAGTHGKSTTSGWLSYCMKKSGIDTNFIIGANISQFGCSSGIGESNFFVAEACEYDRSFLNFCPEIACILNIEQDHLDYYENEGQIVQAFGEFTLRIKNGGTLIANGMDANIAKIADSLAPAWAEKSVRHETFGFDESCDFYPRNITLKNRLHNFDVYCRGKKLGSTRISLPGRHNILNSLAVTAAAVNIGISSEQIMQLLPEFTGMDRRLMERAKIRQIVVLDDYAHHPTEIKASLAAIRQRYQPKRIFCVFQPHQYSRTRFLLNDFAESFKLADITIVPEIYFVRDSIAEKKEVNAQILVEKINSNGAKAIFIDSFEKIFEYLKVNVSRKDLVVTMGAGDIWKVADEYIRWLGSNS